MNCMRCCDQNDIISSKTYFSNIIYGHFYSYVFYVFFHLQLPSLFSFPLQQNSLGSYLYSISFHTLHSFEPTQGLFPSNDFKYHLYAKSWLIGKDSDAGRDWGQEKGMTEDEMAGWHHWLNGRESEWTLGVGDGQGGPACCNSWGRKESDTTERLNWTDMLVMPNYVVSLNLSPYSPTSLSKGPKASQI